MAEHRRHSLTERTAELLRTADKFTEKDMQSNPGDGFLCEERNYVGCELSM